MQDLQDVTEGLASWLRILQRREHDGPAEPIEIPEDVVNLLVKKGFVRRFRDGTVAITLGGIREAAQY